MVARGDQRGFRPRRQVAVAAMLADMRSCMWLHCAATAIRADITTSRIQDDQRDMPPARQRRTLGYVDSWRSALMLAAVAIVRSTCGFRRFWVGITTFDGMLDPDAIDPLHVGRCGRTRSVSSPEAWW